MVLNLQRKLLILLAGGATLAPFLYLLLIMVRYPLLVPYLDQWEFVPILQKSYESGVTFVDLWSQHNEHRLIFPRIMMLALAHMTHWNIAFELAANVLLGVGLFVVLSCQLWTTARGAGNEGLFAAIPALSFLVYNVSQWQNWFFGWQLQEFMNVLAVVSALLLLAAEKRGWGSFAVAVALGTVGTYSFANGLCVWPIGFLAFFMCPAEVRRQRLLQSVIWFVAGLLVVGSYLYHYAKPEYHPDTSLAFGAPLAFFSYVLAYLGAPIVDYSVLGAMVFGGLGVVVFFLLIYFCLKSLRLMNDQILPYLLIALYAMASAGMTGLGRLGFGPEQATSSRYITFAQLLWIAILGLGLAVFTHPVSRPGPCLRWAAATFLILSLTLLSANSLFGTLKWTERQRFRAEAVAELKSGNNADLLQRLHPDVDLLLERRDILRKMRLSIFSDET